MGMMTPAQELMAPYFRQSKGNERSIDEQEDIAGRRCQAEGWKLRRAYRDGVSASSYSTKIRREWRELVKDLDAGRFTVLWLWESSRGDRRADEWLALLRKCRDHGVKIYVETHGRLLDMTNPHDWKILADEGIDSEMESHKSSQRIRRDVADAASKGRPHGQVPYGYMRVYDPITRKLVEQRPEPDEAKIVRQIITWVSKSKPIIEIVRELNKRTIPSPSGGQWARTSVRKIASNPVYVGRRRHNGDIHKAVWPAIVEQGVFDAAQRVLSDPNRKTTRPGKAKYLLSYRMMCGECGGDVQARLHRDGFLYACGPGGCTAIRGDWLDQWVTDLVIGRLSKPDMYEYLTRADDTLVLAARNEAKALRLRLEEFYDSAARGEVSSSALARIEAKLQPEIAAADRRATQAATPPVLRDLLEPDADVRKRWADMPMAGRREVIGLLLDIVLHKHQGPPMGKAAYFDSDRVEVAWREL